MGMVATFLFRLSAIWQTLSSLLRLRLRPEVDVPVAVSLGEDLIAATVVCHSPR